MRYEYRPNDPERFATNLRRDDKTKKLNWDAARGQEVLIVQTPFGEKATGYIQEICEALHSTVLSAGKYTEVLTGVWARFVSAADKARNSGCDLNKEASTYTVFSCYKDEDVCYIYEPQNQAMISAYCDIPLEIHVEMSKIMKTEGLFKTKKVDTGFYSVTFPRDFGNGYVDGDLLYRIADMTIPVTKQMIEQRKVFIKTAAKPVIISKNKGLRLV